MIKMGRRLLSHPVFPFDKTLLSMGRTIGGLFLLVKGYFASKSRGMAMRLGEGGGVTPKTCCHEEQENVDKKGGQSLSYFNWKLFTQIWEVI